MGFGSIQWVLVQGNISATYGKTYNLVSAIGIKDTTHYRYGWVFCSIASMVSLQSSLTVAFQHFCFLSGTLWELQIASQLSCCPRRPFHSLRQPLSVVLSKWVYFCAYCSKLNIPASELEHPPGQEKGWRNQQYVVPFSFFAHCFRDWLTADSEPWLPFALSFVLWFITQCTDNLMQWSQAPVQLHVLTYSQMMFQRSFMLKDFWVFSLGLQKTFCYILFPFIFFFYSRKISAFLLLRFYCILAHFPFSGLRLCCI